MTTTTPTKGQAAAADVAALLRARSPLLWIVTTEEARVERLLIEAAAAANYVPHTWDIAQGATDMAGRTVAAETQDVGAVLAYVRQCADETAKPERRMWIMRDLPIWLTGPVGAVSQRQVRNLARYLPSVKRETAQALIVLTPSADIPPELAGHATVIEWPLPDRAEIAAILDAAINSLPEFEAGKDGQPDTTKPLRALAAPNGTRDAAIDAAVGLTGEEAQGCYARSLVQLRRIDPATVAGEKRRVIAREQVLQWYDPLPGGLDAVGGLDNLKAWLLSRSAAYTPAARAYGLPSPKGALLVGISGCGKSLTAKAVATAWGCPLLRFDLGALKGKFVGESEGKIRKAFRVIEAIGRCVVWIDELEKALQGATSGSSDGGVSADALGAILNWMQERQGEAFVIATANDVSGLPPEMLRKGRFDEIWFVDMPTAGERVYVLDAALRVHGRGAVKLDRGAVAKACDGFTGAEIAAIVPDALYAAFADSAREIETGDLLDAARTVVPLSKTAKEKITALREWAKERARHATGADPRGETPRERGRQIDLG